MTVVLGSCPVESDEWFDVVPEGQPYKTYYPSKNTRVRHIKTGELYDTVVSVNKFRHFDGTAPTDEWDYDEDCYEFVNIKGEKINERTRVREEIDAEPLLGQVVDTKT